VMRLILGYGPSYPDLVVLDSTDPAQIRRVEKGASLARTLFIVSSKSGSTIETDTLYSYLRAGLEREMGAENAGRNLVAITDPGTSLAQMAHGDGFRAIYANPPDIGGRYSALSLFGLVPAALIGLDLERLLDSSREMAFACRPAAPVTQNPGLLLGLIMGELARRPSPGRDKLTLLAPPELAPFGPWVEQLVAESTGKNGVGILPVEGEPLLDPSLYGPDRGRQWAIRPARGGPGGIGTSGDRHALGGCLRPGCRVLPLGIRYGRRRAKNGHQPL
jgi:transaldolase/glucose-6-phosphate isomerase